MLSFLMKSNGNFIEVVCPFRLRIFMALMSNDLLTNLNRALISTQLPLTF